jgi:hypothetical protein
MANWAEGIGRAEASYRRHTGFVEYTENAAENSYSE